MSDSSGIHSDAPTREDLLTRGAYVSVLADVIRDSATPLTVAVYGAWGSGKTSLMLQLRDALGQPGPATRLRAAIRTVWFDPWMHQFDDSPALGLLHATADQLDITRQRAVREALKRLAVAVGEDLQVPFLGIRVGKLLKIRNEMAEDELNRREAQARIRQYFGEVIAAARGGDDRIVFFIDDLDRCQPKVALALLEALKLHMDFEGCVFVLGVDREPLEAAVAHEYASLGLRTDSYLDKIIQLPFVIPAISKESMDDFVRDQIPAELSSCAQILALAAADEPRAVKRVANTLLLNHRLAQTATFVEPYDPRFLVLVVLIQNEAPSLFRQLRLDPTLVHELYRGRLGSQEAAGEPTLWDQYVAAKPRLDAALSLITVPAELDLTPYLTLTTLSSPDIAASRSASRGRLLLTHSPSDAAWAKRVVDQLETLGWAVRLDGTDAGTKAARAFDPARALADVDAVVVLIGPAWVDGLGPDDPVTLQVASALNGGVPVVPILVGGAAYPVMARGIEGLARLQAITLDERDLGPGLAMVERALNNLTAS